MFSLRSEMGRIVSEAIWLVCPNLADALVGREPFEGLQSLGEVVSVQEGGKMIPELLVGYAKWGFDEKRTIGVDYPTTTPVPTSW